MQKVVFDKPYRFVPPYTGTFLPQTLQQWILPLYLSRMFGIETVELRGEEHLLQSMQDGDGIILTPNHSRPCDPMVMGMLGRKVGRTFYYMASWHVFMQSRLEGWFIRHVGAFSVYREGLDRQALQAANRILLEGERPLVIFPEGLLSRTNDRLRPFLEGVSFIASSALKQRRKVSSHGGVVIHPVAIKYFLLTNVEASLKKVLGEIESKLTLQRREIPLFDRILRVGFALLSLKELEYLGRVQEGDIAPRVETLIEFILKRLEEKWMNGKRQSNFMSRVKALRASILKDMIKGELPVSEASARWNDLADIYLAVQLSNYPANYLGENPTPERLTETVERFEEDTTDKVRIHGRWRVIIQVGEGLPVSTESNEEELTLQLQQRVQAMLSTLNQEHQNDGTTS